LLLQLLQAGLGLARRRVHVLRPNRARATVVAAADTVIDPIGAASAAPCAANSSACRMYCSSADIWIGTDFRFLAKRKSPLKNNQKHHGHG